MGWYGFALKWDTQNFQRSTIIFWTLSGSLAFVWSPCWSRHHDVKVAIVGLKRLAMFTSQPAQHPHIRANSGEHPDQSDSNLRAICVTSTRHARHSGSGFACTPGAEAVQWQTSCDKKSRETHIAIECNWVVSTKHKGLLDTMLDIMNMMYLKANCKFNHSRTLEAALAFANQVWFTCHVQALSAERRHAGHSGI